MKILVLGVTGLLGSQVYETFCFSKHETFGTARNLPSDFFMPTKNIILNADTKDFSSFEKIIHQNNFDVTINCIGIVPRLFQSEENISYVNSIFPHLLNNACSKANCRLIHISTDCVFNGNKGKYQESDTPDAIDLYGKTKFLGEIKDGLTIRTSIIGHEYRNKTGLLEWFLSQNKEVQGFSNVIWNGLTAKALSKVLLEIIEIPINGVLHIGGEIVNKFLLLKKINEIYGTNIKIIPNASYVCDKSLNCDRFNDLGIKIPDMYTMIKEMKYGWGL